MSIKLTTVLASATVTAGLCFAIAAPASANEFSLTVGNSSITGDPDTDPLYTYQVDGTGHLYLQDFFYGIGSGAADYTLTLHSVSQGQIGANMYAFERGLISEGDPLRVYVKYTLLDQPLGPGSSSLIEQVSVKNISGEAIDLHWFESTDWDVNDSSDGDTAQTTTAFGMPGILQEDGVQTLVLTPQGSEPDRWEIGHYSDVQGSIDAGSLDTAFGTAIPLTGPDDLAQAFQWDRSLAADDIFSYTKYKVIGPNLVTTAVPEPGTLALFGLGLAGLGFARRRKARAA